MHHCRLQQKPLLTLESFPDGALAVLELLVALDGVHRVGLEVAAVAGEHLLEVGGVDVVLEARGGGALVVTQLAAEGFDLVVHGPHVLVQARLGRRPTIRKVMFTFVWNTLSMVTVGHRDIFDINVPPFILKF